ncbi:MAG: type II toxin-antitoxin system VapC family toxin [Planctomycetales bacterium]
MKYVLDASIAIKWFLPEPDSDQAVSLRDAFHNQIHELIAPDTLPVEVAHALTRAERKNILSQGAALGKVADLLSTGPVLHPYLPLLSRAVELSSQVRIGVFDCCYIALAEREQCQVVTDDQRMLTLFPSEVISLSDL